jgi:hypothetical protein
VGEGILYRGKKMIIKKKVVLIPGKLSIVLDRRIGSVHYFSVGECLSNDVFESDNEDINIELNIVPESSPVFQLHNPPYSTKNYEVGKDYLLFKKRYHLFSFKILIENLRPGIATVSANRQYWELIKFKIDNLYPIGIHLTDLFSVMAIKNNDLLLYGASLFNQKTGSAFLIVSLPAVGKTSTVVKLMEYEDYRYLGEDVSYYESGNNRLYCVPFSSSFGHHVKNSYFFFKYSNVMDALGKDKIEKSAELKRIYILENAKENRLVKMFDRRVAFVKILNLQRNNFSYLKNPLFRVADYFLKNFEIEDVCRKELLLLEKMLEDKEIYLVLSDSYDNFYRIIHENEMNLARAK